MEAIKASAHVAGLDGNIDFECAGEAQHGDVGLSSRMSAAARVAWPGEEMRSLAP